MVVDPRLSATRSHWAGAKAIQAHPNRLVAAIVGFHFGPRGEHPLLPLLHHCPLLTEQPGAGLGQYRLSVRRIQRVRQPALNQRRVVGDDFRVQRAARIGVVGKQVGSIRRKLCLGTGEASAAQVVQL
ncbi:hypothetical protein D3C76_1038900 [compost metagenome]